MVRSPDDVTFLGLWAAQDGMKQARHAHISNNPRGFDFEDTAVRWVHRWALRALSWKTMGKPPPKRATLSLRLSRLQPVLASFTFWRWR